MSGPREEAVLTRVEAVEPFDILRARYRTHTFAPHMHETYALGVIERGAARTRLRGGTVVLPAGSVVTIDPGEVHTGEAHGDEGWA